MPFYETSAKDDLMVEAAFLALARAVKVRLDTAFGVKAGGTSGIIKASPPPPAPFPPPTARASAFVLEAYKAASVRETGSRFPAPRAVQRPAPLP